jgi:hypothetical protein
MKKSLFVLFLALFFVIGYIPFLKAQSEEKNTIENLLERYTKESNINLEDTKSSPLFSYFIVSILKNYQVFIILFFTISLALLVLIFFIANFFDLKEVKVFVGVELGQLIISAIIFVIIAFVFFFLENLLVLSSNNLIPPCPFGYVYTPGQRHIDYASCYIDNIIKISNSTLYYNILDSINAGRESTKSMGVQSYYFFMTYSNQLRPMAYKRLDVEIKTTESSFLASILLSLYAQKSFLLFIVPIFGPFLLFLGLIFRSLFFTRRLGGLLIAAGFGLMIIWPLTYLISWLTFSGTFSPSQNSEEQENLCPEECLIEPPAAYNLSLNPRGVYAPGSFISKNQLSKIITNIFNSKPEDKIKKEIEDAGGIEAFLFNNYDIQVCDVSKKDATVGAVSYINSQNCPELCRVFPSMGEYCNETACDALPHACKIIKAMGLENYTSYKKANDDYCKNPDHCSNCPEKCKRYHKEISYSTSDLSLPKDEKNIAIGLKSFNLNCSSHCSDCPILCRQYTKTNDGKIKLVFQSDECKECAKCLDYKDNNGEPYCMDFVPLVSANSCENLCGNSQVSLRQAISGGLTNICPYDCRLYFDSNSEKYKDPLFKKYCEGQFKDACSRCPLECKLNVSSAISQIQPSSTCSPPPEFVGDNFNSAINQNCNRCPVSCRFKSPSSSYSQSDINFKEFYSKSFIPLNCTYYTNLFLVNSNGVLKIEGGTIDKPLPSSIPPLATTINPTTLDSDSRCPEYIINNFASNQLSTSFNPSTDSFVYFSSGFSNDGWRIAKPNQFMSDDCSIDKDAQTFCSNKFCPSDCFFNWPKFGTLLNISNRYSRIDFAMSNCGFTQTQLNCYNNSITINSKPTNQDSYKFMVFLNHSGNLYKPAGVDNSNCFPSNTNLENLACYPILSVPSSSAFSNCLNYVSRTDKDRPMINGSACPYNCRYLELKNYPVLECGNFTLSFTSSNPAHNCEPFCNGLIRTIDVSYCQSEAYTCSQQQSGEYWVRISSISINKSHSNPLCNMSVVRYNSTTYKRGDSKPGGGVYDNDWWVDNCYYTEGGQRKYINFTLYNNSNPYSPYLCQPGHKYAGLDELISSYGYNYRECGDINTSKNPNYVFCGEYNINYNGQRITISALPNICYAEYNARAILPLGFHSTRDNLDFSTTSGSLIKQEIKANQNCQLCPPAFRIYSSIPSFSPSFIFSDFIKKYCNSNLCPDQFKVKVSTSSTCQVNTKFAIACPIRCRLNMPDGSIPFGCDPKDKDNLIGGFEGVGYSCDRYHLPDSCKVDLLETDCDLCYETCEEDCMYKPYIRKDCSACTGNVLFSASTLSSYVSSQEGLITQTSWIAIGLLLIPSLILPSFSIVILITFIRGLSTFLGGDIEIFGLYKII